MINGRIDNFLDTGWYSESTVFYDGYIYWLEANTDIETDVTYFWVDRWKAEMDDNKELYHSIVEFDGSLVGYERVLELSGLDMDQIKKQFIEAKIFDGKNFWEIEKKLAWLDEGEPQNRQ